MKSYNKTKRSATTEPREIINYKLNHIFVGDSRVSKIGMRNADDFGTGIENHVHGKRHTSRPFSHPVACCCVVLGVVAQSLKPVTLLAMCRTQQLPTL